MDNDDIEPDYSNAHRVLLQAFLSRGIMPLDEGRSILAAIMTAKGGRTIAINDVTESGFLAYLATINSHLEPYEYEIRTTYSQLHNSSEDRTPLYALVNTSSDALTQLATTYTAEEIAFLKRVLDAIFETNNTRRAEVCAVTSMQAVRLAKPSNTQRQSGVNGSSQDQSQSQSSTQGLTMQQAESMLKRLVDDGWFEKSRAGYFILSPRALMELRGWLVQTYNEPAGPGDDGEERPAIERIKFCAACRDIVTVGQRCPDRSCLCRLHNACIQRVFRADTNSRSTPRCPLCKTEWTGTDFVGEKAATGSARGRTSAQSRHIATSANDIESDEDGAT